MVIKLKDKIYDDIKEKNCKVSGKYMKTLGIISNESEVKSGIPKKNIDFMTILAKLDLIEINEENLETIDEFHDYLFKLGLELGVSHGKRQVIDAIKSNSIDFKQIMEIDPEEYTKNAFEPTFISDMKEALK